MNLTITDVRAHLGDSAFLIDDGYTSVLYDTGFGFTGRQIAENIRSLLGGRTLDYILLTHSHYDHVLAAPHICRCYPDAKVIAGGYACRIFAKPTAREAMRALDRSAAQKMGITDYEDLTDELHVDLAVRDGDEIACGDMKFRVISLPGHTKCSVGFYLEEKRLLLASETLGVYFGRGIYIPIYLVGYQMTLDSFAKAEKLDIDQLLIPHYGVIGRQEAQDFLAGSKEAAIRTAKKVREILSGGGSKADAYAYFREMFYTERIRPAYPIDAFNVNTSAMIALIERELM